MTDYVRDALAKTASGAHVAFATVHKGAGPDRGDRVVGCHTVLRDLLLAVATRGEPSAPRRARRRRHRFHLACRFGAADSSQHGGQAVDAGARLRGLEGAPGRAADRRAQQAVVGGHRADRRPTGRHHARRPARLRRHRSHVSPLLHRGGRVAGREGAALRRRSSAAEAGRARSARRLAVQARASVAEMPRRCSACTAASASSFGRTAATALPVRWIFQAS